MLKMPSTLQPLFKHWLRMFRVPRELLSLSPSRVCRLRENGHEDRYVEPHVISGRQRSCGVHLGDFWPVTQPLWALVNPAKCRWEHSMVSVKMSRCLQSVQRKGSKQSKSYAYTHCLGSKPGSYKAEWPSVSCSASLCLSFLICKMGIIKISHSYWKDYVSQ